MSERVPECYVCPITNQVMVDPVSTVDGYSFERGALEAWLCTSQLSPLTGERLASTVLIPNRNLRKAIELFQAERERASELISVIPRDDGPSSIAFQGFSAAQGFPKIYGVTQSGFSSLFLGPSVELPSPDRAIRVVAEPDMYKSIVFISHPLKAYAATSRLELEISSVSSEWGGLLIGVTRVDFRQAAPGTLMRLVDDESWFFNSQGWFHHPEEGDSLFPWSTANLLKGDSVVLDLPDDGRFCLTVNGVLKVDAREAGIPQGPLFAFVGLFGSCTGVNIKGF